MEAAKGASCMRMQANLQRNPGRRTCGSAAPRNAQTIRTNPNQQTDQTRQDRRAGGQEETANTKGGQLTEKSRIANLRQRSATSAAKNASTSQSKATYRMNRPVQGNNSRAMQRSERVRGRQRVFGNSPGQVSQTQAGDSRAQQQQAASTANSLTLSKQGTGSKSNAAHLYPRRWSRTRSGTA